MTITVEHLSKGVSLVTLSAETSRNGLNMESMKSMSDIMGDLLEDSSIKSIIMTGSGKFFCSGADIDSFASAIDNGNIADLVGGLTSLLHPMQLKIRASEKIFIAASAPKLCQLKSFLNFTWRPMPMLSPRLVTSVGR